MPLHDGLRDRLGQRLGQRPSWRWLVPVVFAAAGFLFATSAVSSDGDDLRPDRTTSLTALIENEREAYNELQARADRLEAEIDRLSGTVDDQDVDRLTAQVAELREITGMTQMRGPAVMVTLDDAPYDQPVPAGFTANDLVVHQQDIQAVVNALWEGGAEGITLQGQRIISTTGIKCVGNTVLLHGVPYSPPYKIVAVGKTADLVAAVNSSEYIQIYRQYTRPPINIGWDLEVLEEATLPPYASTPDLEYAEVTRG